MDVCNDKFALHLSDKTHAFGCRFIHGEGVSFVILQTWEHAAHVVSHMIVYSVLGKTLVLISLLTFEGL